MNIPEFLQTQVSLFDGIDEEGARVLAQAVAQQSFTKGQTVLFKGVTVDGLHIVASGKVSVHAKPKPTASPVQIAELGPGEVFGETSILENGTAGATIKCAEDQTLVYMVPQNAFRELVASNPAVGARALALIASRKAKPPVPALP